MTVEYQPAQDAARNRRRQRWHRANRWLMVLAGLVLLGVFLIQVEVRTDMGWVDARSGTLHEKTIWFFGYQSPLVESRSAFSKRLIDLGLTWQPDWRNIEGTGRSIYGHAISRGHGSAPPSYVLRGAKWPISKLTDDEILQMNTILAGRHPTIGGDEDEQKRAIDDFVSKAFDR